MASHLSPTIASAIKDHWVLLMTACYSGPAIHSSFPKLIRIYPLLTASDIKANSQVDLLNSSAIPTNFQQEWWLQIWVPVLCLLFLAGVYYLIQRYVIISIRLKKMIKPVPGHGFCTEEHLFMEKIQTLIQNNYQDSDFTACKIIQELAMSRTVFYRKFKCLSSGSVNDLIRQYRLEKASELLHHSNLTVSEVAYASGFSNPAYFSTVFKEHYNTPPVAFREKQTFG